MAGLPYIQLYIADYLADTPHLSIAASGAYLHLLFNYWQTGKPLKACPKRLAAIARATPAEWELIKDDVLEFFVEQDGFLIHKRIEKELKKAAGKGLSRSDFADGWKGYVYFIGSNKNDDEIKIGYSKNPWSRLKDLQTSSSKELLLLATLKTTELSEKNLHKALEPLRVTGEWFKRDLKIISIIKKINEGELTTVGDVVSYYKSTVATNVVTTKDTDTDTDTDKEEKKKEKNKKKKNEKVVQLSELEKAFEIFWSAYPNRVDKQDAKKAYLKLNPDPELQEKILFAIDAQIAEREIKANHNVWAPDWKMPATWLNKKTWENEIAEESVIAKQPKMRGTSYDKPKSKVDIHGEACAGAFTGLPADFFDNIDSSQLIIGGDVERFD